MSNVKFVGMDVHKKTIAIAIADDGRSTEVRYYGCIDNSLDSRDRFIRKLNHPKNLLRFVYEAGPCGYAIYRHLSNQAIDCMVTAPALIPKKGTDRIKTDRRDAQNLARLHRSGELTAVYVPRPEDEAMRDLTRAREDALCVAKKAKQRLNAFLLRRGFIYSGRTRWSRAHMSWLANLAMPHRAQKLVLDEYLEALNDAVARVDRLTEQIRTFAPQWSLAPVVEALQAARGVSLIVATTMVAELGDLKRFEHPRQLMAYLGLVPSEHSSGEHRRQGAITKTGNRHVRRVLVEAAWSYRLPARRSRHLLKRHSGLSKTICRISWQAQLRLCARYWQMSVRGKAKQVAVTAIARELSGFLWAIAQEVETPV